MNKLLKTVSLTCLFIFMAVAFSGCNEKKIESEFFYFPVLNGTTWQGEAVYYGSEAATFDVKFVGVEKCEIAFANSEEKSGTFKYNVAGRILQFFSVSESLPVPQVIKGAWLLVNQEPGKLYLESSPNISGVKSTLVLTRK